MISTHQHSPIEALRKLAGLYPDMWFEQLMIMGATLVSETTLLDVAAVSDGDLTAALTEYIQRRRVVLAVSDEQRSALEEDKELLLQRLQAVLTSARLPLGRLVTTISDRIGRPLFDVEDLELIRALHGGD